jgi:hypothetical protein
VGTRIPSRRGSADRRVSSGTMRRELVRHIRSMLGRGDIASWSRWYANLERDHRFRLYATVLNAIEKGSVPGLHGIETLRAVGGLTVGAVYAALGANPDLLPVLSVGLDRSRTRPVSTCGFLSNPLIWLPARITSVERPYRTMPLSEIVRAWTHQPMANLAAWRKRRCVYGQIGLGDGGSFPAFPPGAFIQVDPDLTTVNGTTDPNFYFVRHPFGYSCCRCAVEKGRIFLLSSSDLYPELDFEHPGKVHIVGRVRAFCGRVDRVVPPPRIDLHDLENRPTPSESVRKLGSRPRAAHELLHSRRVSLGITYGELDQAAKRLRGIVPNWKQFGISGGHAHKIDHDPDHVPSIRTLFPLLALYGLDFREVLAAYRLSVDDANMIELPALYRTPTISELAMAVGSAPSRSPFARSILDRWLEWPALLCCLGPDLRTSRVFYYGGDERMDPLIKPDSFLLVDEGQADIPAHTESSRNLTQWEPPLFLFLVPGCGFVAGYAERNGDRIQILPHPRSADQRQFTISNSAAGATIGRIVGTASLI